jgi:hypothetical protein
MGLLETAMSIADKLMDKIPNYDQRKKEKYYKLKRKYENEKSKVWHERDDQRIDLLRYELCDFLKIFNSEISA